MSTEIRLLLVTGSTITMTYNKRRVALSEAEHYLSRGYFMKDVPGPQVDYYPIAAIKKVEVDDA
jgi:hypothetical protein